MPVHSKLTLFIPRRNLVFEMGGRGWARIPGTLIDEWRALVVGHLSVNGTMGRAPLLGKPKNEIFERYAKCPVNGPPSLQGPCWETWRGFACRDY